MNSKTPEKRLPLTKNEAISFVDQMRAHEKSMSKELYRFDIAKTIQSINAGTTIDAGFDIPADADVRIFGINVAFTLPNAGINLAGMQIKIPSQQGPLSNDYIPLQLIATPGQQKAGENGVRMGYYPFKFFAPRNSKIEVEIYNPIESVEPINVWLLFMGEKLVGSGRE